MSNPLPPSAPKWLSDLVDATYDWVRDGLTLTVRRWLPGDPDFPVDAIHDHVGEEVADD